MPACGVADRPKMPGEMLQTLKNHILRQREKLKQGMSSFRRFRSLTPDPRPAEQEQDAAMERHRREQEMKRKRNALSLEEINDQLTKLQFKVSSLREEKHQLFTQLKKVCSEDDERKKQNSNRGAELLAQQQALQSHNQLMGHPLTGYSYLPGALMTRPPDPYHRTSVPVTSSALSVPHGAAHLPAAANGTVGHGKAGSQKRRYAGSPLPVPSSRPLQSHPHQPHTSSFSSISNPSVGSLSYKSAITAQSVPSESHSACLLADSKCFPAETSGAPAGYPFYFGAQVPTTMAYDSKGNQCYVAVPVSESAHREMLEQHYQQQMRNMGSHPNAGSSVMPIQVASVKPGGISTGFPVPRPGSSPAMNPVSRDLKSDPHGRPYPRYF